jgi:hypothetical protein
MEHRSTDTTLKVMLVHVASAIGEESLPASNKPNPNNEVCVGGGIACTFPEQTSLDPGSKAIAPGLG